jgi:hypothetical protein
LGRSETDSIPWHAADRFGVGKWRLIQKDETLGPELVNRSNVDLKVSPPDVITSKIRCKRCPQILQVKDKEIVSKVKH